MIVAGSRRPTHSRPTFVTPFCRPYRAGRFLAAYLGLKPEAESLSPFGTKRRIAVSPFRRLAHSPFRPPAPPFRSTISPERPNCSNFPCAGVPELLQLLNSSIY